MGVSVSVVNVQDTCDSAHTVALYVQVVYEARFVLAKDFCRNVWPRLHDTVLSICNRTCTPLHVENLLFAKVPPEMACLCVKRTHYVASEQCRVAIQCYDVDTSRKPLGASRGWSCRVAVARCMCEKA
jgi:hypothetical protein